ncbi:MAG: hypothetical protein FJ026_16520, partial [Chloroflexi bacterium]|nr:hypothetical protein [Chloroflexota bacterium]
MNSLSYGYLDANHRHALTHVNGVEKYKYDAAGNMYERDSASLSYDIQNRLRSIWENGQPKGEFTYDSYGARMYEYIPATNSSRRYIGEHYEWAVYGTYKKYYLIGGVRVAFTDVVNQQPTLYWLLQDHLGSTAVTAETNGNVEGKVWYYPYGEKRDGQGDPRTTYLFTGQR